MKFTVTVLTLILGTVTAYPQQSRRPIRQNEQENFENDSKEVRRAIYPEQASGNRILKTIRVSPHVVENPQEGPHESLAYSLSSTPIPILRYDKSQALDGSYKHSYETGNSILAEETGFIKNLGIKDQEALVQHGSFQYTAPDGTVILTKYTADEGGFRVEGAHLPTPPPIPEEIQKGLETIYEGIRLQQEAEARDAKLGKSKPQNLPEEEYSQENVNYPRPFNSV